MALHLLDSIESPSLAQSLGTGWDGSSKKVLWVTLGEAATTFNYIPARLASWKTGRWACPEILVVLASILIYRQQTRVGGLRFESGFHTLEHR